MSFLKSLCVCRYTMSTSKFPARSHFSTLFRAPESLLNRKPMKFRIYRCRFCRNWPSRWGDIFDFRNQSIEVDRRSNLPIYRSICLLTNHCAYLRIILPLESNRTCQVEYSILPEARNLSKASMEASCNLLSSP